VKKRFHIYFSNFSQGLKHLLIIAVFPVSIAMFYSCKPDSVLSPTDVGYDYFPLKEGQWVHYDVDSTVWDDFTSQTYYYHSQILEVTESRFIDAQGKEAFRIERFHRQNDTAAWVLKDVWQANLHPASAELVEENVRFIKLAFPIRQNQKWNGNALNYLSEETYTYKNLFKPYTAGMLQFDSTVTVEQSNSINLIEEDIRYEIYAKHTGLVKKYVKKVKKNIAQPDIIVSGIHIEYTIRNSGHQ
jgi:hypothetical protein